jgi:hypothetical protein
MDPNTEVAQSKVFLDPLLGDCWRRYFYAPIFFRLPLKACFREENSGVLLEMLSCQVPWNSGRQPTNGGRLGS